MKKIKWGIIGPGTIAKQFAHDFKYTEYAELIAVASRSQQKALDFAKTYSIPKAYSDYQSLYNDSDIDIIYIATPHNFHFEQASAALLAGKSVLCEKPLTVTPAECAKLTEIARSSGCYLMEGMWTYFLPAIQKAQEWVSSGKIGEIQHVKADFGYAQPEDPKSRWLNPNLAGGVMLDMGCYTLAIACLFLGSDSVNMSIITRRASTGVDNDISMLIEYKEATASLSTSFKCKLNNWAYIIGDKGYIAIPDFWRTKEAFLYENEAIIEHFKDSRQSFGFNYETDAACLDLLNGKTESEVMPHSTSQKLQELMHTILNKN